ncbi:MAG: hypothetical protein ACYTAN_16685 [Planctomycetota bacterium]|jgi:hypothetical protein
MSCEGKERIEAELKAASADGRVPCKGALALAVRLDVEPREVGAAANELGIKIVACQLGCF